MSRSVVGRGHARMSRAKRLAVVGVGVVVIGGLIFWEMQPRAPRHQWTQHIQGYSPGRPLPDVTPAALVQVPHPAAPKAPAPIRVVQAPPPAGPKLMGFWEDKEAAKVVPAAAHPAAPASDPDDPDVATPKTLSDYAQRMQTTQFANTTPIPHHFHVHYTIKKGTKFDCLPDSPISSELPGPISCTVTQDVWSMDGGTVLLPRGTQVNGTVEHGLGTGQERLFIVWTDALTPRPDLLAIPLDAPGADDMGQVGVPGDLNEHLWKKLKATLLVTAIQTVSNVAVAAAEAGHNNNYFGGLGGSGQSMAQMAFGHDLDIPTTLYRGPSQPVTVYTTKYIDLVRFYQDRVIR